MDIQIVESEEIIETIICDENFTNESTVDVEFKADCKNEFVNFKSEDLKHNNVTFLGSILPSDKEDGDLIREEEQNINKTKPVRRFGRLEIPEVKEQIDSEYDTYVDDKNQIYKKYKLRENRQKPNYRIPTVYDLPKECDIYKTAIKRETVTCPHCNLRYESCSELRKHIRQKHKITYTCLLCKEMFETNAELINHKKLHEEENRMYLCHECKEAFSNHCDFLLHELTHTKVARKMFTCPECGYLYYSKTSYEIHIITHFNRPLNCPICSKEVNGEIYLKRHINEHSTRIECVECGHIFNDTHSYKNHMAIHTGVKLYQCLYCGKGFRLFQQREVHTRIHNKDKLFSCKLCNRKFGQKIDLQRHIIKHDPDKKLKCTVCSKMFKLKMDLASHMRVHAKEYSCPECNKKLSSKAGLKAHILFVHTTDRPEVCNLCDMKFVDKAHLKRHYRSKSHKNNEYKATIEKGGK